ncbi:MAG TPA: hypothetical protein VNW29_06980 [Candidatus Sulfotelmatobacter sp.]|nr:hypothetical protein [Candidatus Sulfotelmatobacter sp.]
MTKKKKTFSTWLRQEINTKLSYAFIFLLFLFCVLIAYTYSIPSVGIPIESQIQTNFQNFIQSLTHAPKEIKPIHIKVVGTPLPNPTQIALIRSRGHIGYPEIPASQSPYEQLPNQNFDLLRIYQTRQSNENTAILTKIITNPVEITEIYDDIKSLPLWPQGGGTMNCPMDPVNPFVYILNFYSNDILNVHALLHIGGCSSVSFTNYSARMALGTQGKKLDNDLQQILNLSKQAFYGY